MADLFSLLVRSGAGLAVHSTALATAGHNIANANTPGYARQSVNLTANAALGSLGTAAVGQGVSLQSISQSRDQFVERQLPNAFANRARSQAESEALSSVSALNPELEGGVPSALSRFYSSLRTLSQNPSDLALRQSVIGASRELARAFNQTAASIEAARDGIDSKMISQVNTINAAARTLADLNRQIQVASNGGANPNDLIDARHKVIDELAALTGSTPYVNSAGDVSMAFPGGTALVSDTRAGQLSLVPDASNGGHLALRFTRADGSGPVDTTAFSIGGEMAGLLAARDGALADAATDLDTFAFDFADAVNDLHRAGFAMDGTGNRDLFVVPVTSAGAASQIAVSGVANDPRLLAAATSLPAGSGDNRNILAMMATESQALAGGSDPVATIQQIIGDFGIRTAQAHAFAEQDAALANHLTTLRESVSGVSIDEEMINLTKAQKAFEALSKVVAAADDMLDVLMKLR